MVFLPADVPLLFIVHFSPPGLILLPNVFLCPILKYSTSHRSRHRLRFVYIFQLPLNCQSSTTKVLTDLLSSCRPGPHTGFQKFPAFHRLRRTIRRLTVGFSRPNSGLNQMAFFHFEVYIEWTCHPVAWIVRLSSMCSVVSYRGENLLEVECLFRGRGIDDWT